MRSVINLEADVGLRRPRVLDLSYSSSNLLNRNARVAGARTKMQQLNNPAQREVFFMQSCLAARRLRAALRLAHFARKLSPHSLRRSSLCLCLCLGREPRLEVVHLARVVV